MFADRVQEATQTVGTGTLSLDGAPTGRRTFVAAFGSGQEVEYFVETADGANWEHGFGVVNSGTPDTLTRVNVQESSNANALVNFPAGAKRVFVAPTGYVLRHGVARIPTAGGTADARTVSHNQPLRALKDGMRVRLRNGAAANATTSPTLSVDATGVKAWRRRDGSAPAVGEFAASVPLEVEYHAATDQWRMAFDVGQQLLTVISPSSLSTSQNDWNPSGLSGAGAIRVASSAAIDITGLTAIGDARTLWLHNVGAFAITLKDESASSAAANRFAFVSDWVLSPDESVALQYDATTQRWRAAGDVAAVGDGGAIVTAGENLADRDLIYQDLFNQRGGGATRWYKVDADATSPVRISPRLGIALAAITSGNTGSAQVRPGRVAGFSGLTAGQGVWASATAGIVTQTEPAVPSSGTQNAVRLVGYAASATEIDFDPDDDTVFVARNSALAVAGTLTLQHFTDAGARERIARAYVATDTFGDTARATLDANYADRSTYAIRQVIPASAISTNGTAIQIVLRSATGEGLTFTTCRIQQKAGSGNAWDFSAAGVTVTFGGGTDGGTIAANSTLTSDTIAFTLDETKDHVVTFYISGGGAFDSARKKTTLSGWQAYDKIGSAADASATAPSGFSTSADAVIGVEAILVNTGVRDEPVTIGSEQINSGATDRVTVKFTDASDANPNTHTTAINRTGATRDLIVEVTL